MAVTYKPNSGITVAAFRCTSTIIPMVLKEAEFWVLLVFNITVCTLRRLDVFNPETFHVDLPWSLTGVTGSLMTFFVVFYNGHVFSRYNRLYDQTKGMCENALKVCCMLRVQVYDDLIMWKVAKWVMSSILMFFFERTNHGEDPGSKINWEQLVVLDLLTKEEVDILRRHCRLLGSFAVPTLMVLTWSMELIQRTTVGPEGREDMLAAFYETILKVRSLQVSINDALELPMPFQYFHIMNMMLMLNLLLWAYALGCQDSFFAPVIYAFVQVMFQGIRELSTALSDPFGDDEVDFPVSDWLNNVWAAVYGILQPHIDVEDLHLASVCPLLEPSKCRRHIDVFVDQAATREPTHTRRHSLTDTLSPASLPKPSSKSDARADGEPGARDIRLGA